MNTDYLNIYQELPEEYESLLFPNGYLLSKKMETAPLPFMERKWKRASAGGYHIWTHPKTDLHLYQGRNSEWVLIGHLLDPWNDIASENEILKKLDQAFEVSWDEAAKELKYLTGRFCLFNTDEKRGFAVQDAVGLLPLFYFRDEDDWVFASHAQLIGDIFEFKMDKNIEKITNSWFFSVGIRHLPGLKSPFSEFLSLSANTVLPLNGEPIKRFFPDRPLTMCDDLPSLAKTAGKILSESIKLYTQKGKTAQSLTTGTDSRVTFAASKPYREQIFYFSYTGTDRDKAEAAEVARMCEALGQKHTIYDVPPHVEDEKEYAIFNKILNHNTAYVRHPKAGERLKIYYLHKKFPSEYLELKSHVSGIGRASYCKKMGRSRLPERLEPRDMSNLFKRNLYDRESLRYTDQAFHEFRKITKFGENFYNYEEPDMFHWEHRMTTWAAMVAQDHDISHKLSVPFNNRELLNVFLQVPRPSRIKDDLYREIIFYLWPELLEFPLSAPGPVKGRLRKGAERFFFAINRL